MSTSDRTLRITKLAVIESLRENDGNTGEQLAQEIRDGLADAGAGIAIQVLRCGGAVDFRQAVAELIQEAQRKEHYPMLHIECHGDDLSGLEFGDGSVLPWGDLMDLLGPLNEATELGLVVSVAACFGFGAIRGVDLTKPAPFYSLVGPSEGIWSNELFDSLKAFYLDLVRCGSTDEAIERLRRVRLESGQFEVITVRQWFRHVVRYYLEENTSIEQRRAQAMRQHRKALAEGVKLGVGYWKRQFVVLLPQLLRDYHGRFFMVDRFPQHAQHFGVALSDVTEELRRRGFGT